MRFAGNFLGRNGGPAELFLEGGSGFVVAFDGGDAGQGVDECLDAKPQMQQSPH